MLRKIFLFFICCSFSLAQFDGRVYSIVPPNVTNTPINSSDILLDPDTFKLLPMKTQEFIKENAEVLEQNFNAKINFNDKSFKEYYNCEKRLDEDVYYQYVAYGYDKMAAYSMAMKNYCNTRTVQGFEIEKKSSDKPQYTIKLNTTWQDYLKFHGNGKIDYSIIAEKNLQKSDLKDYDLTASIKFNGIFKRNNDGKYELKYSWVNSDGNKPSKEVLKYYDLDSADMKEVGTISEERANFFEIYQMFTHSKRKKTNYKGPSLVFKSDNGKITIKYPLWKFSEVKAEAEKYANPLEMIVNDAISMYGKETANYKANKKTAKETADFIDSYNYTSHSIMYHFFKKPSKSDIEPIVQFFNNLFESASIKNSDLMIDNMKKARLPKSYKYLKYESDDTWNVIKKWGDINLKSTSGDNEIGVDPNFADAILLALIDNTLDEEGNFNSEKFEYFLENYRESYYETRPDGFVDVMFFKKNNQFNIPATFYSSSIMIDGNTTDFIKRIQQSLYKKIVVSKYN